MGRDTVVGAGLPSVRRGRSNVGSRGRRGELAHASLSCCVSCPALLRLVTDRSPRCCSWSLATSPSTSLAPGPYGTAELLRRLPLDHLVVCAFRPFGVSLGFGFGGELPF